MYYYICIVLIGAYPANQLFLVNAGKDVMYALFVVWTIVVLYDITKRVLRDEKVSNVEYVIFSIFEFFVLLWRNNSIYALVIAVLFIFLTYRKKVVKLMAICGIVALVYVAVVRILFPSFGISGSSIAESLAVPEQQMTSVYVNKRDSLTKEQEEYIQDIMPDGFELLYNPTNSDNIRPRMKVQTIEEKGIFELVKNWFEIGVDNPLEYAKAFLNNTRGYWYLFHDFSRVGSDRYIEYDNFYSARCIKLDRYMLDTSLSRFYYIISDENFLGNYRAVSWLFSIAFSFWMYMILAGYAIYAKAKRVYSVYIYLCGVLITLLLGPLALMRYIYPFTLALPFLLFINADE